MVGQINPPGADGGSLLGVTRTICVGIGGTGRDVLMRVRRTIIDQFGSLSAFPIVSFVQIDTDGGALQGTGLPTGNNYQGQSITFNPNEVVHASVDLHQVKEFTSNYQLHQENPYAPNPDNNIIEWFPGGLVRNLTAIENGAGALRPVGRFAFFKNFIAIQKALENAFGVVNGAPVQNLINQGINVNPGLRVFVAGSLCGGTGSGMVLDIGYLIEEMFALRGALESHGFFIISPDLYGNTDAVKANTYAALTELDYYSRVGTQFNANYPGIPPFTTASEPYKFLYLLSNSTSKGAFVIPPTTDPDAKGKITNVIAQKICLFFTSTSTASMAVSSRDNIKGIDAAEPVDKHPRPNRQRYMTAGLSSIYFPQDRIMALAANQAKQQIIDFWQNGIGQAPNPVNIQASFESQYQWNDGDKNDPIKQKLETLPLAGGQSFNTLINGWVNDQENIISGCSDRNSQDSLKISLGQQFNRLLENLQVGSTEQTRGAWLTELVNKTDEIEEALINDINHHLESLLQPQNSDFSLMAASHWLETLQTTINSYKYSYQKSQKNLKTVTSDQINSITQQMQQSIQSIQSGFWPFGKNVKIQETCRNTVSTIKTKVSCNYTHQLLQQCVLIVNSLSDHINQKQAEIRDLQNLLNQIKAHYQQRDTQLQAMGINERIGLALVDPADVNNAATKVIPTKDPERKLQLSGLTTSIIDSTVLVNDQKSQHCTTLSSFLDKNRRDLKTIQENLDTQVDQQLAHVNVNGLGSAIHRFMGKGSEEQLLAYLTNLWNEAQYLLPLVPDGYFNNTSKKLIVKVAFHNPGAGDPTIAAFQNLLAKAAIPMGDPVNLPPTEQHHVIFITEYAGFPLRIINDLNTKGMQFAYRQTSAGGGNSRLHTDRRKALTDIIPPDANMMENLQKVFFQSLALGDFEIDSNTGALCYGKDGHNVSLGNDWSAAIDQLAWAQQMADEDGQLTLIDFLKKNIENFRNYIKSTPAEWPNYKQKINHLISQIRKYPENHINYHYSIKVAGTGGMTHVGAIVQKGLLENFIEEIDGILKAQETQDTGHNILQTSATEQKRLESKDSDSTITNDESSYSDV